MFESDISHRRSVAVLCMMYKTRSNPMHPLYCAIAVSNVPVRVTRGALVAHRYTYTLPRSGTSQYRRTFIPLAMSLCNDLDNPVFDGGFKNRADAFFTGLSCWHSFCLLLFGLID